ncbi:UNVERIFIED_ORG: hypothetical protein QQG_4938 [Clostridioides difficile Y384]
MKKFRNHKGDKIKKRKTPNRCFPSCSKIIGSILFDVGG